MMYLKKLFFSIKNVAFIIILEYLIVFLSIIIFSNKAVILGSVILGLMQIIYIAFKCRGIKFNFTEFNFFPFILLGISICIIYNMFIFKINGPRDISYINTVFIILFSDIIGPIFEEVLFRYNLVNSMKKFNSNFLVIILSSLIFGVFHNNIVNIIYAIIIGFFLAYWYIKTNNLLIPIIIHISGNLFSNLLFTYNTYILLLGFILFIISNIILIKKDINFF